jgi:hypothetical protein
MKKASTLLQNVLSIILSKILNMKYASLLCFLLLLIYADANSQKLSQGSWMLGGGLTAENREIDNDNFPGWGNFINKRASIAAQPQIAFFIANQIAAGVRLYAGREILTTVTSYQGQPSFTNSTTYNSWGVGGFAKIYHPLGARFFFDLEIGANYQIVPGSSTRNNAVTNEPLDAKAFELYANPGISFFFNSKWVLQSYFASIYFMNTDASRSSLMPDVDSGYGLLFGPQAMVFRLNYFFGKEE